MKLHRFLFAGGISAQLTKDSIDLQLFFVRLHLFADSNAAYTGSCQSGANV